MRYRKYAKNETNDLSESNASLEKLGKSVFSGTTIIRHILHAGLYLRYYDLKKRLQNETRSSRFKRIASKRTNDIIKKMNLLGNCSNRSSYNYSEQEINKIFSAIEKELKQARARFTFNKNKTFKL